MTPQEIEAAIRAAFPDPPGFPVQVNHQRTYLTGAEYEARLAEMVAAQIARQEREAAEAAHAAMVAQYVAGMQTLRDDLAFIQSAITNNTNLTQTQIKTGFRDVLQALIWIGERIGDGTIPTRRP
jgi:hypothetical protein